jgi:hypothetical protein
MPENLIKYAPLNTARPPSCWVVRDREEILNLHYATDDPIPSHSARMLRFGMISHASGIVFL